MSISISAVVCTYNRRAQVLDAIKSLLSQDLPGSAYEVIVVDNASTDNTSEFLRAELATFANVRIVLEPRQGISCARNRGAREAKSNIVAYLDDDAIAPPDYLRRYVELFSSLSPVPAVAGGDMAPIFGGPRPDWLTNEVLRWASSFLGWSKDPCYLAADGSQWLCETNSAYRVDALMNAGGFPENLGRVGDSLLSSEGHVNIVLHHAGFPTYYDPRIVVRHHVPVERLTRTWFRRRAFWQGVSCAVVRDYLASHGIHEPVYRPLSLPASPEDWVHLFNDHAPNEALPGVLLSLLHLGYVLAAQNLLRGR
jgi:glycosyltransferase involved in cell wall biosynthesis